MIAILSYGDDAILFSKSGACLQRLNKVCEFGTSSSLEVNLSKTKIMIFGCNKRKLTQEAFYLEQGPNWDNPWI